MNKTFKKMALVVAFALVLALGAAVPAFAAEPPPADLPMTTTIRKNLVMADGVSVPAGGMTFHFDFVPQGAAPNINAANRLSIMIEAPNATEINTQLATILPALAPANAGALDWLVTEYVPTPPKDGVTYDATQFRLRAHFRNLAAGGTELAAVEVHRVIPPDPPETDNEYVKVGDDGFVFTNIFIPNAGDANNPAARISKTITGDRTQANLSTLFSFSATFAAPTLSDPNLPADFVQPVLPLPFTATIVNTATGNPISDRTSTVVFTTATQTFQLRDGETLNIPTLPAGTTMSVTETGVPLFTPSVVIVEGNVSRAAQSAAEGANLTTGPPPVLLHNVNVDTPAPVTAGLGVNAANFSNAYRWIPPSGLIMSNLPIAAVVVAVAALGLTMVMRRRKRIEELPVA